MPKIHSRKNSRGFTLIELLVVISIIGLLSSIVLASVNQARQKGINAAILSEVRSRETAVNLLLQNSNGLFPNPNNNGDTTGFYCYAKSSAACTIAGLSANGGSGLYAVASPNENQVDTSQLASAGPPQAQSFLINSYIGAAQYNYGTVAVGPSSLAYSVGIFYRCASSAPDGLGANNCTSADIYWVQAGTTVCQKGQVYLSGGGNNNVICYQGADGNNPY